MKPIFIFLIMLIASTAMAQYTKENLKLDESSSNTAYRFEKLQLYPIRATRTFESAHEGLNKYTSLEKALNKKAIQVTESGTVNELVVENTSKDTILILAGEVLQGGKQDRMVGEDIVLYPNSGKRTIPVFCVEHGRWQAGASGKSFDKYYTISSNEVRKAGAVKKNQQEVWDKVSENTQKNKAATSTGTLAALRESEDFNKELVKYADHFGKVIVNEKDVVGVVAVSGDKILGCDMFASHALLVEHYKNLVNSYATEAITSGDNVKVAPTKVGEYLDAILDIRDEKQQEKKVKEKGTILKDGEKKLHISTF